MTPENTRLELYNGLQEEAPRETSSTTNELTELINIEDTPFTAVRIENKYFLAMGKYRLTELFDTYEAVTAEIHNITWNRLTQVIAIICMEEIERAKNNNTTKPQGTVQ